MNTSCFLRTNHENYQATCKRCIEELIEETWTCNYTQEARVLNRMCSVEYRCSNIPTEPPPEDDDDSSSPKSSAADDDDSSSSKIFGVELLIFVTIFVVVGLGCTVVTVTLFKKSRRKSEKLKGSAKEWAKRQENEEIDREQIEKNEMRHKRPSNVTPNAPPAEAFDPELDDFKRNVVLDRSWLQIERPIGNGNFGCVYKGTLRKPGKEIRVVAVKKLRRGASFTGEEFVINYS